MGRPLNSRLFGPEPGKLRFTFNDGEEVVQGYVVKQTGSRRFLVTTDGETTHEVTMAETAEQAENLEPGICTIPVKSPDGETSYVTNLTAATCQTSDGQTVSWSTDPTTDSAFVIDTSPQMTQFFGTLSREATRVNTADSIWAGQPGNKTTNYSVSLNTIEGIELGLKTYRRNFNQQGVRTMDGETVVWTVPAEPLTSTGGVNRVTWALAYSAVVGIGGASNSLNDYEITLSMNLDPTGSGEAVVMKRNFDSSWSIGETTIMVIDNILPTLADVRKVDQNITNIGYQSFDAFRPEDIDPQWAEQAGHYDFVLTAKKNGVVVAETKLRLVTAPGASW